MNQDEQKPCCVNCHISGVPLYLGLDGKQHCADHIGLLLPDSPKQQTKPIRPCLKNQDNCIISTKS